MIKFKKQILYFLLLFACFATNGQDSLVIGKSDKVSYLQSEHFELDSIVSVKDSGMPYSRCNSYKVYFDDSLTQLAFKSFQSNDSCFYSHYWRNGGLKHLIVYKPQVDYADQYVWWYEEMYCKNGQLLFKGPSPSQPQKKHWITYHCNGNKKIEFDHLGFGPDGKMTMWYENGIMQQEFHFKNSIKVGIWKYWNVNGVLMKEELYENDTLQKAIDFPLVKQNDLLGCWTDSREENTDSSGISIFRRCHLKSFPVSRFRFKMELKEGGICLWMYLAPNDAHHMKDGTWTYNKMTQTLRLFNTDKEVVKSFKVSDAGENILKVKN
jgi:hypothetical protein